ncbi:hypothetical protein PybrP1_011062 [[Pythium] brassicae (nom. inval.)]|nr:hypothetical protein PybrP1_011062 [[Pythium] brassicae (nom. inval.)]
MLLRRLQQRSWQQPAALLLRRRRLGTSERAFSGAAESDTIFALSSAEGKAGVAVVRISGDQAERCLRALTGDSELPPPRVAALRKLHHPLSREHLDDALALRFPQPRSFTGEDVVELHVHGSVAVVSGVLEALSHVPHCRAAEPGEFTERAFANNKIDLVQVEGLADLLSAETEAQRAQALRQLSGEVGDVYEHWRTELVRCLAYTEAMIDFGDDEDDVTDAAYAAAIDRVRALAESIRGHLADGRRGEILRSGVQVAIVGPPNAGKSSLLNDTQLLYTEDYQTYLREDALVVLNKSDQASAEETAAITAALAASMPNQLHVISCVMSDGIDALVDQLAAVVKQKLQFSSSGSAASGAIITRERHRQSLVECVACLDRFLENPHQSELAAEELRLAVVAVGRILGRVDVEDVLDSFMIELTACEVYANEPLSAHDGGGRDGSSKSDSPPRGERSNQSAASECSGGGTRAARVLQADYLPPVPDKALAFDSFCLVPDKGVFGGRHDGAVVHWQTQQSCSFVPPIANLLRKHGGPVLTMVFAPELGKEGLLFSGSVDRTVKIWDPWGGSEAQVHSRSDHYCVQTIPAHSGSVTSLKIMPQQHHGLVSCSLDHTIKTWYPADGRGLLLYPWYVPAQTITYASGMWPTSLVVREGSHAALFVGDSSGCISLYTAGSSSSATDAPNDLDDGLGRADSAGASRCVVSPEIAFAAKFQFTLRRKLSHFHSLGVLHLQLVADNSLVVSLGFDQKASVLDAISGALSSTIPNPRQTRFTCCSWDQRGHALVLADALGHVMIWDVFQDRLVRSLRVFPTGTALITVSVLSGSYASGDFLFAGVASCMKQWRIDRDVGYAECTGHSEAVTALVVVEDDDDGDGCCVVDNDDELVLGRSEDSDGDSDEVEPGAPPVPTLSSSRFFSASLDNTVRCWDSYDMKATFGFEERDSEVTAMAPSRLFRRIFTGHESGLVKAWGIHTGRSVSSRVHTKSTVTCVTSGVMRDQEFLLAGDMDGMVTIWEVTYEGLTHVATLSASLSKDRREEVSSILFNRGLYLAPHGQEFFVVGHSSGHISIWSLGKRLLLQSFKAHSDSVSSLAMHGWFLFSGSDDTLVRMWNLVGLATTYGIGTLRPRFGSSTSGTGSPIVGVDVVPEVGLVVSAAADGSVVVWDYGGFEGNEDFDAYGKIVYRNRHESHVQCMRYWPRRRSVICGSSEGKIVVFELPPHLFERRQQSSSVTPRGDTEPCD